MGRWFMSVKWMLDLFKINNTNDLNMVNVRYRFRELMKLHHPDKGGSNELAKFINVAYEFIKELVRDEERRGKLKNSKCRDIYIIGIDELCKIYNNESIEIKQVKLNRQNMSQYKVVVNSEVNIEYKGSEYKYNNQSVINLKDKYNISCKIIDDNITSSEDITIKAYGKEIKTNIEENKLNIVMRFDGLVELVIFVERLRAE